MWGATRAISLAAGLCLVAIVAVNTPVVGVIYPADTGQAIAADAGAVRSVAAAPLMDTSASFGATADTYVRSGAPNTNEGASTFIRLQASGDNRGLVRFDQTAMQSFIGSGTLVSAKLRLTITDINNSWGSSGRTVDVHRLKVDWAEGNGCNIDCHPPTNGTGAGATWNCAVDSDISNQQPNCSGATQWEMGMPNNPSVHPWVQTPTSSALITNGQSGVVEWDVTADVAAFHSGSANNYGWIVKKTDESQAGQVQFGTRQDPTTANRPVLVITINPAPTNTPTPTPTSTFTPTPTSTSTSTFTPTPTLTPTANPDTYAATGNISIGVPAGAGVLVNDVPDGMHRSTVTFFGPTGTETAAGGTGTTTAGGTLSVQSDGSFVYDPPAGFTGADTFKYTMSYLSQTAVGTVTINVSDMIWFVNNNAFPAPGSCPGAPCDGRLSHPFTTLGAFQAVNSGAPPNPQPNQSIFLYESTIPYAGPVVPLSGQKLIGQDATASLQTISGITPAPFSPALPAMNTGSPSVRIEDATAGTDTVNVSAGGNLVRGLTLGDTLGSKLAGTGFGTLILGDASAADVTLDGAGQALNLTTGTLNGGLVSTTSTGGTNNVSLTGVGTSGTYALGSGALSAATQEALEIDGGAGSFSYGGSITNATNRAVRIENKTGTSTVTLGGAIASTAPGTGIFLNANSAGTTTAFSGTLSLTTGASPALTATNAGTVTATAPGSTITTTTGTGVNVTSTTIGAAGLKLQSVSVNGATSGIVLNGTGTSGGLSVTGTGSAGSGGTIQNTTSDAVKLTSTQNASLAFMNITSPASGATNPACNASAVSATCEAGVEMVSATTVTLDNLVIDLNNAGMVGVAGLDVNGLTMTNSTVRRVGDADNESGLLFQNLTGTVLFQDLTVDTVQEFGLRIFQPSGSGNLAATLRRVTIENNLGAFGEDGLSVRVEGGTSTFLVDTAQFLNTGGSGIAASAQGAGGPTLNMTVRDSNWNENRQLPHAVTFATAGSATGRLAMLGNNVMVGCAVATNCNGAIDLDAADASSLDVTVDGVASTSSGNGTGLELISNDNAQARARIVNNSFSVQPGRLGMNFQARAVLTPGSTGRLDLTLANNTINGITSALAPGMSFQSGASSGTHAQTLCANLDNPPEGTAGNNVVNGTGPTAYTLRQRTGTTFQLEGLTGSGTVESDVESFVQTNNPGGTMAGVTDVASAGGTTIVNYTAATCQTPSLPPLP